MKTYFLFILALSITSQFAIAQKTQKIRHEKMGKNEINELLNAYKKGLNDAQNDFSKKIRDNNRGSSEGATAKIILCKELTIKEGRTISQIAKDAKKMSHSHVNEIPALKRELESKRDQSLKKQAIHPSKKSENLTIDLLSSEIEILESILSLTTKGDPSKLQVLVRSTKIDFIDSTCSFTEPSNNLSINRFGLSLIATEGSTPLWNADKAKSNFGAGAEMAK